MRRLAVASLLILLLAGWWVTAPSAMSEQDLPNHSPDASAGERVFWAGGCASCHATPVGGKQAKGAEKMLLGGGMTIESPYGVFRVPNISQHADGIGGWSMLDFVNAMQRGVSPDGRHYYPSFPYGSYTKAATEDVMDLKAYLDTLPAVAGRTEDHALSFPWSVRRGLGAWKRLYLDAEPIVPSATDDPLVEHGRELVEGMGHCGECHTARDRLGGLLTDQWLAGAPNPEGKGSIPNITPGGENIASWSAGDIAYYLESGLTPDYDTAGGTMVAVQENMAQLTPADRQAIAAYLKTVPAIE